MRPSLGNWSNCFGRRFCQVDDQLNIQTVTAGRHKLLYFKSQSFVAAGRPAIVTLHERHYPVNTYASSSFNFLFKAPASSCAYFSPSFRSRVLVKWLGFEDIMKTLDGTFIKVFNMLKGSSLGPRKRVPCSIGVEGGLGNEKNRRRRDVMLCSSVGVASRKCTGGTCNSNMKRRRA